MIRKAVIGLAAVLLICAPSSARAGIVVGASAGETGIEISDPQFPDFDESDFSWKAFGGFRFLKFFGLQAEYLDFGNPEGDGGGGVDVSIEGTGWNAAAEGVLPIGSHFEVFAKAGYVFWDVDSSLSGAVTGSEDETGEDFNYGVGVAFILGKLIGIRGEWQRFEIEDTDSVDFVSVGVDFRF